MSSILRVVVNHCEEDEPDPTRTDSLTEPWLGLSVALIHTYAGYLSIPAPKRDD